MIKNILIFGLLVSFACGSKSITYNYEAQCGGIGSGGTYLVKINTYGKSVEKAKEKSKSHAVHAVLFKGITSSGISGSVCQSQKPICNVTYSEKQEWFDNFFNSGAYLQYVTFSNDARIGGNRIKMADGNYKIAVIVTVNVDALRKKMEKEGMARSLGGMF